MKPTMYIFANRDLGMSHGKFGAQCGHAAVNAFQISKTEMVNRWTQGGHYAKVVLLAEDREHLMTIERYVQERGFRTSLVIDEGRTEIAPMSVTAMGVEIVDKDDAHVQATFEVFQTFKYQPQPLNLEAAYNTMAAHDHLNRRGRQRHQEIVFGK